MEKKRTQLQILVFESTLKKSQAIQSFKDT